MEASPLTLEELCMDKYVLLLEQFTRLCSQEECASQAIEFLSKLWWKNDYVLTEYLSEMLLRKMKHRGQCNNALLYLYSDFSSSRLRRVSLSKSDVTDEGLMYLRCQHLIELDVSHCKNITLRGLMQLLRCQPTLQVLKMSNLIFQDEDCSAFKSSDLESLNNIRKLDVSFSKLPIHFLRDIFRYMTKIVHLNLEGCYYTEQTNDDDLNDSSFNVDEYIGGVQALRNIEDVDLSSHAVADLKPLLSIKRLVEHRIESKVYLTLGLRPFTRELNSLSCRAHPIDE